MKSRRIRATDSSRVMSRLMKSFSSTPNGTTWIDSVTPGARCESTIDGIAEVAGVEIADDFRLPHQIGQRLPGIVAQGRARDARAPARWPSGSGSPCPARPCRRGSLRRRCGNARSSASDPAGMPSARGRAGAAPKRRCASCRALPAPASRAWRPPTAQAGRGATGETRRSRHHRRPGPRSPTARRRRSRRARQWPERLPGPRDPRE